MREPGRDKPGTETDKPEAETDKPESTRDMPESGERYERYEGYV